MRALFRSLILLCAFSTAVAAQLLDKSLHPIYAGTRHATVVQLSAAQELAVGAIYHADETTPFCSGSLVDDDIVLTARHCFDSGLDNRLDIDPLTVEFRVGRSPESVEARFTVAAYALHPHVDLAMLRLSRVASAHVDVEPLAVITSPLAPTRLTGIAEAAGHGRTESGYGQGLYFLALPITCVDDDYVQVSGDGSRGICEGDSGGPLLVEQADGQIGILAVEHQGSRDCVGQDAMVRLDRHRTWLEASLTRLKTGGSFDPCGGLRARGRCVDGQAQWCQDGLEIVSESCVAQGQVCGLLTPRAGVRCRDRVACAAQMPAHCAGGMVVRCVDGALVEHDCVAQGKVCIQHQRGADCVPRCFTNGRASDDGSGVYRPPGQTIRLNGSGGCAQAPTSGSPIAWLGVWLLLRVRRRFAIP